MTFRCVVIALTVVSPVLCLVIPDNPCPNVFAYRQQNGIYYGEVIIPSDGSRTLTLAVNVSMMGLYDNLKVRLDLSTPTDGVLTAPYISYRVNFPFQNVLPKITQITYNGRIYCYGPPEPLGTSGVTNLWSTSIYKINQYTYTIQSGIEQPQAHPTSPVSQIIQQPEAQRPNPTNPFFQQYEAHPTSSTNQVIPQTHPTTPTSEIDHRIPATTTKETCGIANDIQTLILKGDKTIDNEYPWLVAMFHRQGLSYEFQCTANLISDRHVVTAAHCVWFYKAPLIDKVDILFAMGRSDISHWATDAVIRTAQDVTPHPNYRQDSGHCDVAVIRLSERVPFRSSIRPICLWEGDVALKRVVGDEGIVAGWGKTEKGKEAVTKPRKVAMPIVAQDACLRSNADFKHLTSDMTFCAGNRDGSGPCTGDSGAGFVIKNGGKWFLRGVVSTAIQKEDFSCNLSEYIVFSDLAKLRDWIATAMK